MTQLRLQGVSHYYANRATLVGLSLSLEEGDIGVLVGPSGAGKSTVLNCIAGLEPLREGEIHIGNTLVSSTTYHVPVEERGVGMMFQDGALFPHLNVGANIGFGLKGADKQAMRARVEEMAGLCQLDDRLTCMPHELSGGQQQRVALARALAPRPRLLLLDEPFSDSDAQLRANLLRDVRDVVRGEGCTMLMVTHDQHEAFALADRCGVIDTGTICQWDTAYNLYHRPNCMVVANFIGEGELVSGKLISATTVATELGMINSTAKLTSPLLGLGSAVKMLMRPDDLVLTNDGGVKVRVTGKAFRGSAIRYELKTAAGTPLQLLLPSREDLPLGAQIVVAPRVDHVVLFPTVS